MSFQAKKDYFGLSENAALVLVSSSENRSAQAVYAQKENGDIVATEIVGNVAAPACSYALSGNVQISDFSLGDSYQYAEGEEYVMTSLRITTAAGSPPTIEASGEQVPPSASCGCKYNVLPANVIVCHHAQDILSAATIAANSGNYLIGCNASIECSLTKATKNGETISYDISDGKIVEELTIQQTGTTEPTLTASNGFTITSPLSKTDPDSSFPTWTCTLEKALAHA